MSDGNMMKELDKLSQKLNIVEYQDTKISLQDLDQNNFDVK